MVLIRIIVVNEEDGESIYHQKEYFVRINGVDYQGVQEVEVVTMKKQFVKAEIFDESQELQDTFPYSSNRSLDFLEW